MRFNIISCLLICALFAATNAWREVQRSGTIKLSIHQGASPWWLAFAVSDGSTTAVQIKESGSSTWKACVNENWGYWTYQPNGVPVAAPISVKLTAGSKTLEFNNLITSLSPSSVYDTGSSYNGNGQSTSAPSTPAPSTPAPTQRPATQAPSTPAPSTPAPTQRPATQAPSTPAPSTPAPSGSPVTLQLNSGGSAYWFAVTVTGGSSAATSIKMRDAGTYSSYTSMDSTSWGAFVFQASSPVVLPVDLYITSAAGSVEVTRAITSWSNTNAVNTGKSYSTGSSQSTPSPSTQAPSTPAPTQRPATQAPATPAPATQAPATPAPTQRPATQAPATQAPSTPAPATQAPATPSPTTKPSSGPTSAPVPITGNPFSGVQFFINNKYTAQVDQAMAAYPSWASKMAKVKEYPSAFWLDTISAVTDKLTPLLEQAKTQQAASGKTVLVTLVVYDLPNRDCAAYASNGELQCNGDPLCVEGLNKYKTQYIDVIVSKLKNYPQLRIVTIVEPDSLPNLATNLGVPKCTASVYTYKTGVAYAIKQLSTLSNVAIYIDAAHGGWLGWDNGREAAVAVFKEVLTAAGGANKVRGFATNVANFQPLGSMTDTADPCSLAGQWNFGYNEVRYVDLLQKSFTAAGVTGMKFIIDTGRNGNIHSRSDCSNWCNIKKAGLGVPPTTNTQSSGRSDIDAYFWVKPPGESDGTSDSTARRYDIHCGSVDSAIPSPEAGVWDSSYFKQTCELANPAL